MLFIDDWKNFVVFESVSDYSKVLNSWQFILICKGLSSEKKYPDMPSELIQQIFFWDNIYLSNFSFYDQQRAPSEKVPYRKLNHLRVSNHWNWEDSKGIHCPVYGAGENKVDKWILGKWTEINDSHIQDVKANTTEWQKGQVSLIMSSGHALISQLNSKQTVFAHLKFVNYHRLQVGDFVYFKSFADEKGIKVSDLVLSNRMYVNLFSYPTMVFNADLNTIYNGIKTRGFKIMMDSFDLKSQYYNNIKIQVEVESKYHRIIKMIQSSKGYFDITYTQGATTNTLKDVKDWSDKFNFKISIVDKNFEIKASTLDELKSEIYKLKRIHLDKQKTFDFINTPVIQN